MMNRIRGLVALLALIALSLSGAGALWASGCAADSDVASEAFMVGGCGAEMASMTAPNGSEGSKSTHPEGPQCPMAPGASSGACSTTATVPSEAADLSALSPENAVVPLSAEQTRDLLLVSVFFRPPRA